MNDTVKEAIRFGWIDGQIKSKDNDYFYVRFTPRGPKSVWSLINRERAQSFIDNGTMMPLGLKAIENGKLNKTWQAAYTSFEKTELPQDLQSALKTDELIQAAFDHLSNSDKLQIIFWISTAKTETTRQERTQSILTHLRNGIPLKVISKKANV